MNCSAFLKSFGRDEAKRVCEKAGVRWAYFRMIERGDRRPAPEVAEALETASNGRLDFRSLLLDSKK